MVSHYKPTWRRELENKYPDFQAVIAMVDILAGRSEYTDSAGLPFKVDTATAITLLKEIAKYTVAPMASEDAGGAGELVIELVVPGSAGDSGARATITRAPAAQMIEHDEALERDLWGE